MPELMARTDAQNVEPVGPHVAIPDKELSLEELADRIKEAHSSVASAAYAAVSFAAQAGHLLKQAKSQVPHGGWKAWVETNCSFSARTARAYMQVAETIPVLNRQHAADLSIRQILHTVHSQGTSRGRGGASHNGEAAQPDAWFKACASLREKTDQLLDSSAVPTDDLRRKELRDSAALLIGQLIRLRRALHLPALPGPNETGGKSDSPVDTGSS